MAAAGAASIQAADTLDFGSLFFDASGTNYQDNTVNITPGQTVDFSFPDNGTNNSSHNVAFGTNGTPGPNQPTSCVQTVAPNITGTSTPYPILASPPLPCDVGAARMGRQLHVQHARAPTSSTARSTTT